jgi:hypothetical protein
MQRILIFIMVAALALPLVADDRQIEVSEDSWQTVILEKEQDRQDVSFATDEVPFNSSPDWSCDLRMQVGGLSMADLDADGDLDLAIGCYHSQSYPPYDDWRNFILYNIDGELEASPSWWSSDASSTGEVCTADFNDDGHPDIFAGNGDFSFDPSRIYYYSETNDSIQREAGWASSDNCWTTGAAAFDFDQDGDVDIATSNQGVSPDPYRPVHIFVNHDGSMEAFPSWSSSEEEISGYVAWGDYDQDGWYDLAVSKWANFYSCVYHNMDGSVYTYPAWYSNNDDTQKGVAWADVNGDDYPELVIGGNGLSNQLYPNDQGTLGLAPDWESNNSFHGVQDLRWADIDYDGDPDLATVNFSNGQLRIYLNIDGVLESTPSWIYDASPVGTAVEFGDIDGDGLVDLIMGVSGQPCVMVFYNTGTTGIDDNGNLPSSTTILANYPNPFNAQTRIFFNLKKASDVKLNIYDLSGRVVKTLVNNHYNAGRTSVIWDGRDNRGIDVASGVYFYRLETSTGAETQKMVMLK